MIWFFTPYATDRNYFDAIDSYMKLVPETDWVCILDGDTMFMYSDFGHKLHGYIDRYPDTGLFSCVSNRCHYLCQQTGEVAFNQKDIVWHKHFAEKLFVEKGYKVKEVQRKVAGHLLMIKKSTWTRIRDEVQKKVIEENKKILGVDTKISKAVMAAGLSIRIMEGFYLFHFLRFDKQINDNSHLQ